jgi:catechol 2,3-dioxygenase-like lactoylglutathione lyase family enzyme
MNQTRPRVTSLAPQFLVDDLERSIAYYQRLGFKFGEPWGGFYAIGCSFVALCGQDPLPT